MTRRMNWATVPREPTEAMLKAVSGICVGFAGELGEVNIYLEEENAAEAYRAMIAAAPDPITSRYIDDKKIKLSQGADGKTHLEIECRDFGTMSFAGADPIECIAQLLDKLSDTLDT